MAFVMLVAPADAPAEPPKIFSFGDGIPAVAPDGETPVAVLGISQAPDGTRIASVLTNRDNVSLMEYLDDAWVFQDFVAAVTKSPWHSYAVEMTGKVFTDNGAPDGTPLLASALTPDGRHYSATAAGVWDDTTTPSTLLRPVASTVRALAAGPDGALAFSDEDGLYLRPDAHAPFTQLHPADGVYSWHSATVDVLGFDSDGRLWIGGDAGAGVWNGTFWKLYTDEEGLVALDFTCIAPGANGAMWFGTTQGVLRVERGAWTHFAGPHYLPSHHVNAIVVDDHNLAWIATTAGISRIPEKLPPRHEQPQRLPAPVPPAASGTAVT
jgi:hypothetical protein